MDSTSDTISFTYKVGDKTIKSGVSEKLTKSPGVLGKSYSGKDILENNYIGSKFLGEGTSIKGPVLDIIYWLRSNMQALQYTKIHTSDDGKEFSFGESKKFFDYEKNLSGLLGIPRVLDGVYDYASESIELLEVNNKVY